MTTLVLIYHGMSDDGGGTSNLHALPAQKFLEQIKHLKQSKYRLLSWRDLSNAFPTEGGHGVSITFDDGCASDLESARLLREHGYDAMFFIATELLGMPGYLTRDDIVTLRAMGMGIGSHAHHHAMMGPLSETEITRQFRESKNILEDILKEPVEHFSFPGGSYDQRMLEIGRQIGYRYFFTSDWGSNNFKQCRAGVFRRTSVLNHLSISQFDDLISSRHDLTRRFLFGVKEFAKRAAGEERYIKLRQMLLAAIRPGK
jgi:peptidoglycan/xylan/chitin deacetylase (PgdA/CDA1 family)